MLLNSYEFLFVFMPASLIVYFALRPLGNWAQTLAIVAMSIFFYWLWSGTDMIWLVISIATNFALAFAIWRSPPFSWAAYATLCVGIVLNIGYLAYFKYSRFFFEQVLAIPPMFVANALPLGISFFTFTQLVYLIDLYKRRAQFGGLATYSAFVTFYPHLPSGPLYHYSEIMPQFSAQKDRPAWEDLTVGWTIFVIGFAKKTIADQYAPIADFAFSASPDGLTLYTAWIGALAYSLQIYFDFSGYSDMAIGTARMFGIVFPANFRSPYKATNIIEFWRHWHMTLSRFLRDYVYIPFGGNRSGEARRMLNILLTMMIGGLWHGANWTFIAWGTLHGLFLIINHSWRRLAVPVSAPPVVSVGLTFLCVAIAWVFFRAKDLSQASTILQAMAGLGTKPMPRLEIQAAFMQPLTLVTSPTLRNVTWMVLGFIVVWAAPTTQQIMRKYRPVLGAPDDQFTRLTWAPSPRWAVATVLMFAVCLDPGGERKGISLLELLKSDRNSGVPLERKTCP